MRSNKIKNIAIICLSNSFALISCDSMGTITSKAPLTSPSFQSVLGESALLL